MSLLGWKGFWSQPLSGIAKNLWLCWLTRCLSILIGMSSTFSCQVRPEHGVYAEQAEKHRHKGDGGRHQRCHGQPGDEGVWGWTTHCQRGSWPVLEDLQRHQEVHQTGLCAPAPNHWSFSSIDRKSTALVLFSKLLWRLLKIKMCSLLFGFKPSRKWQCLCSIRRWLISIRSSRRTK